MAYVDVTSWAPEHVICWVRGLHESIRKIPLDLFVRNRINGQKLMLLNAKDCLDILPSINAEALERIMGGIEALRYLHYNANKETLQSLTLNLACQARYLYNQLIQAEISPRLLPVSDTSMTPMTGNSKNRFDFAKVDSNMQINQSTKQRVSLETLDNVSIIVDQISRLVNWLNLTRSPADESKFNKDFKNIVLRIAVELTSTAQRDQFVEQPNDVIKKTSNFLAEYCEWLVLAITDPDFIQPCTLDVVSVKKKPEEDDYGIVTQDMSLNALTITEVVFSSPAHRSGRIAVGDEIVQVDYQTVVGWPIERIMILIRGYQNEVILTIRKKPCPVSVGHQISLVKSYAIPNKRMISQSTDSSSMGADTESLLDKMIDQLPAGQELVLDADQVLEPPKEPTGPVYELQTNKSKRGLKRRVSISGDIPDSIQDMSLGDDWPILTLEEQTQSKDTPEKSPRSHKEALTKGVSHDTARMYLHTLSMERKHLWQTQSNKDSQI